jgi:Fic family protein
MLKLISEIDEFKGSWKVLRSLSPDRLKSLKYIATIESIGSSTRIEGAVLSDKEIEALLRGLSTHSFASRDQQEVVGYAQTMDMVYDHYADIPISENYIKQLHRELLRHSVKDERHRGEYKKFPNNVEAFNAAGERVGTIFETVSPFDTPGKMQDLIVWTRDTLEDKSLHPLIVSGIFTVVFLAIHPFQDGNGRLSRVLTSLLLLKADYSYIPYSSLESVIENNKDSYYLSLRRTQTTLASEDIDWVPWLRFYHNALKQQKDHLNAKLEPSSDETFKGLSRESIRILEFVTEHERITTREALELSGSTRPTVKARLSKLVLDGHLQLYGKGRGAFYRKD